MCVSRKHHRADVIDFLICGGSLPLLVGTGVSGISSTTDMRLSRLMWDSQGSNWSLTGGGAECVVSQGSNSRDKRLFSAVLIVSLRIVSGQDFGQSRSLLLPGGPAIVLTILIRYIP